MNLHPLIPNHKIPKCLQKSLVIGNLEQIKALKLINREIENKLAKDAKIESGELKSFEVTISFEGSQTITVYAENETQAKDTAIDIVDFYDCDDTEANIDYIRETKSGISNK